MEKKIENIIRNKEYIRLNTEELLLIQDWVEDEVAFYEMKEFLNQVSNEYAEIKPSSNLKKNLMADFRASHGQNQKSNKRILYLAVSAAAVLVVVVLLYPTSSTFENEDLSAPIAEQKLETKSENLKLMKEDQANSTPDKTQKPLSSGIVESEQKMAEAKDQQPTDERMLDNEINFSNFSNLAEEAPSSPAEMTKALQVPMSAKLGAMREHADFIATNELPASKREFVQANPNVLDFLYTAY